MGKGGAEGVAFWYVWELRDAGLKRQSKTTQIDMVLQLRMYLWMNIMFLLFAHFFVLFVVGGYLITIIYATNLQ